MASYAFWRLIQAGIAVFGVLTIVFVIMRFSGDPTLLLVPEGASREHVEALRRELGFDRPVIVQYFAYLGDLLRLDFGNSVVQRIPAVDIDSAPSAIEGRMREDASADPEVGSQPSKTPKTRMRRMPDRNVGMLCPVRTIPARTRSRVRPRHTAIATPAGTPTAIAIARAPLASMRV